MSYTMSSGSSSPTKISIDNDDVALVNDHDNGNGAVGPSKSFEIDDSGRSSRQVRMQSLQRNLYLSHFLSTWNSRTFEFSAVLFLARIFPATLLPSSVYALVRAAATILLSPSLGDYIDRRERLAVIRTSIGELMTTWIVSGGC